MGHRKLIVYQRALSAAIHLDDVARRIPVWRRDLREQLKTASASIPLNIAEGAGEFRPAEKARFYRIARRSCSECHAILDLAEAVTRQPGLGDKARSDLMEVTAMLARLIERRAP